MAGFYQKRKDTSKDNIAEAMKHLNKKPARQGSNQRLEDFVKPEQQKSK